MKATGLLLLLVALNVCFSSAFYRRPFMFRLPVGFQRAGPVSTRQLKAPVERKSIPVLQKESRSEATIKRSELAGAKSTKKPVAQSTNNKINADKSKKNNAAQEEASKLLEQEKLEALQTAFLEFIEAAIAKEALEDEYEYYA